MSVIEKRAYAKINLAIDVLGKAENGYHFVDMLMTTIGIYDTVKINILEDTDNIKIISENSNIPLDDNNICYRACTIMKEKFSLKFGANIFIEKNIPVAAGLGGGSSDAAAVIMAIADYFNINYSDLDDICFRLGADVKFAMNIHSARAVNYGEELLEIDKLPNLPLLLIKPNFNIYTKEIYDKYDKHIVLKRPKIDKFIKSNKKSSNCYKNCYNVLEEIVTAEHKEIEEIENFINNYSKPILCQMSGSGPTIYAIYNNVEECNKIYNLCLQHFNSYEVLITNILN